MEHDQPHKPTHATPSHAGVDSGLAGKILERIKDEKVVPRPRWEYAMANLVFWTLWVACTLAGAAAVAAAAFVFANSGWEFRSVAYPDMWRFLIDAMPLLWISALIVLMVAAYENLRQTSLGYRYPMIAVIGLSVIGSIILGATLYAAGVGEQVEERVGSVIPMHHPIMAREHVIWMSPARGLLAGEVQDISPDQDFFTLRAFDGRNWEVSIEDVSPRARYMLMRSSVVRVIGLPGLATATSTFFRACFIFPWNVRGSMPSKSQPASPRDQMPTWPTSSTDAVIDDDCAGLRPYQSLQLMQERMGK